MLLYSCDSTEHFSNDLAWPNMAPQSRAGMQQHAETLNDDQIREFLELRAERAYLHEISGRAKVEEEIVRARSMVLMFWRQKSIGVLESNLPPLMYAMPLLHSPHILF